MLTNKNSVSLVVCGKFHYFNYVRYLQDAGRLHQFIYSHKWSSSQQHGVGSHALNLWPKEYLYQAHLRLLGGIGLGNAASFYHAIWEMQLGMVLEQAPVVHFLLHGNCLGPVAKGKLRGAIVIAEAVNSHPENYFNIVCEEYVALGLRPPKFPQRLLNRMLEELALADHILVPSQFVQNSFARKGEKLGKIKVIPYGANLRDFTPPADPDHDRNRFKVICVAQVTPRKGLLYLIKAWKKNSIKSAELHIYGVIDRSVLYVLDSIGAPNVFFHGPVRKPELISALRSSDLFVLPTSEEGFAVSILEAMACELPILTTENSGAHEVLSSSGGGAVVPIRSVDALSEKLEEFYRDASKRRHMGKLARKAVVEEFNWTNYSKRLCAFYDECILGKK